MMLSKTPFPATFIQVIFGKLKTPPDAQEAGN